MPAHRGQLDRSGRLGRGRGRGRAGLQIDQNERANRLEQLMKPENQWRLLYLQDGLGAEDELEKLSGYRPGGYHLVHLHDTLNEGRYRVVHKLGYGGFSTVWLCRDTQADGATYVAVKILVASESDTVCRELLANKLEAEGIEREPGGEHICLPLHQFDMHGPNGRHICLVYPVLGPSIDSLANRGQDEEDDEEDGDDDESDGQFTVSTIRNVSRQAVLALSALHERGICHGDLRPKNILLGLQDINGSSEAEVLEMLGEPEIAAIGVSNLLPSTTVLPHVPRYMVYPIDYDGVDASMFSAHAYVTDFGQAFDVSQEPLPTSSGIPVDYRAPEMVLNQIAGTEMDLWSLGCTLFEIRTGQKLFNAFQLLGLDEMEYMLEIASLLGKPPTTASSWLLPWEKKLRAQRSASKGEYGEGIELETSDPEASRLKSIRERLEATQHHIDKNGPLGVHLAFSENEVQALSDLLEKLLRWDPEQRIVARDVLEHDWFKM